MTPRWQHSGAVLVVALVVLLPRPLAQGPGTVGPELHVPHRLFRLANGLTVILHQDRSVPVIAVNLWYHVGSANEKPGRTGFAHLFEHLMFEGSKHVPEGDFDVLIEAAGGSANGSTNRDRTNYYIDLPSHALELALFLESDRMGFLLDTMSASVVDGQRDVVKNERRQVYDNQPYGQAWIELDEMLFPPGHPYRWPTIGYMEDLSAATYHDVVDFFTTYYVPNNASLVIAGDIDLDRAQALAEKWFGGIPRGPDVDPLSVPPAELTSVTRRTITDRVQLPRLYLGWLTPQHFASDDAALDVVASVLGEGKNSRLYKRLVYDMQMVQDVSVSHDADAHGGSFLIIATARPGSTMTEMQRAIDEELERLRHEPPSERELRRAVNQIEAAFYRQMERVGSYRGKAERLNAYYVATGDPDYFAEDLARYRQLGPGDVQAAVARWLPPDRRVELLVKPAIEP